MLAGRAAALLLTLLISAAKAQQIITITQYPSTCSAIYTSGTQSVTVVQSTVTTTVSPTPFSDEAANNGTPFVLQITQPGANGSKRQASRLWLMPNGNTTTDGLLAAQFYITDDQLRLVTGGYYSTSLGTPYQPFAASSQLQSINTSFSVFNGALAWDNQAFTADGAALFFKTPAAAVANAQVIASFTSDGSNIPASWAPISLTAREVREAVPQSSSASQTVSVVTSVIIPGISSNFGSFSSMGPAFTFAPSSSSGNNAGSITSAAPPISISGVVQFSSALNSAVTTTTAPLVSLSGVLPYTSPSSSSSVLPSSLQSLSTITEPGVPLGPIRPTQLSMGTNSATTISSNLAQQTLSSSSGTFVSSSLIVSNSQAVSSSSSSSNIVVSTSSTLAFSSSSSALQQSSADTASLQSSSAPSSTSLQQSSSTSTSPQFSSLTLSTTSLQQSSSSTTSAQSSSSILSSSSLQQSSPIVASLQSSSSSLIILSTSSSSAIAFQASSTSSTILIYQTSSTTYSRAQSTSTTQITGGTSSTTVTSSLSTTQPSSTSTATSSSYVCPDVNGLTINDAWGVPYVIGCGQDTTYGNYDAQSASSSWNDCFLKCHNSTTNQGVGKCTAFTYLGGTNGVGPGTCFLKNQGSIAFTSPGSGLVAAIQAAYYASAGSSSSSSSLSIVSTSSAPLSVPSTTTLTSTTTTSILTTTTTTTTTTPVVSTTSSASSTISSTSSSSSQYLILTSPTPCNFGDPAGTDQDDSYCEIDLPFSLTMYSVSAPQTFASTNGYISMINGSSQYQVNPVPFSGIPDTTVLPLFDDLYLYGGASPAQGIFYQATSTGVTYEYYLGRVNSTSAIYHFTVGYSTSTPGVFTYTYYNIGNGFNGNTSSIGSQGQNAAGTEVGAQYSYQSASVTPGTVVVCSTLTNSCRRA